MRLRKGVYQARGEKGSSAAATQVPDHLGGGFEQATMVFLEPSKSMVVRYRYIGKAGRCNVKRLLARALSP